MLDWVNTILASYVATAPHDIIPILLLDLFSVHMKGMVTTAIQNLGIEVFFIPPGCTGLVQPVDVGFNKSFKAKMHQVYTEWLLIQDTDKPIPAAKHDKVAAWIIAANRAVSSEVIINAWKKMRYSYFPDEEFGNKLDTTAELTMDKEDGENHIADVHSNDGIIMYVVNVGEVNILAVSMNDDDDVLGDEELLD